MNLIIQYGLLGLVLGLGLGLGFILYCRIWRPLPFLVSSTIGITKMRLTRCLYSLLVCSVVFSGGGLAAVGEEDDGSFHVNSWVVEVHAGEGHAAQLAERHGFIKHGQVRAPRWMGVPAPSGRLAGLEH